MANEENPFDTSLAGTIDRPSPAFREFLSDYFFSTMTWVRHEEDRDLPAKLAGREREIAEEMILANLRTQRIHLTQAAARLGLAKAIPVMQSMLADNYGNRELEGMAIETALFRLNALTRSELHDRHVRHVSNGSEFAVQDVMMFVNELFPLDQAKPLIDLGLRRPEYSARCRAYHAAVEWHYIKAHGGIYTERLSSQVSVYRMTSSYVNSEQPEYYPQIQYYIGDAVARHRSLLEERIAELWIPDRNQRRMPFFTEINHDFTRKTYPEYFDESSVAQ